MQKKHYYTSIQRSWFEIKHKHAFISLFFYLENLKYLGRYMEIHREVGRDIEFFFLNDYNKIILGYLLKTLNR